MDDAVAVALVSRPDVAGRAFHGPIRPPRAGAAGRVDREPLIIEPRSTFAVLAATRSLTTQVVEEAGLLGYQFCPKAKLITKEPTA
jgi:hypothetical protein